MTAILECFEGGIKRIVLLIVKWKLFRRPTSGILRENIGERLTRIIGQQAISFSAQGSWPIGVNLPLKPKEDI
jgi:hypothetical protein